MKTNLAIRRRIFLVCGGLGLLALIAFGWWMAQPRSCCPAKTIVFRGRTMGTGYTVKLGPAPATLDEKSLAERIDQALEVVNARMSTYKPDSELSRFNASRGTDWFDVSSSTAEVIAEAIRIGRLTYGAFDVTIGPLVRLWNFGAGRKEVDDPPTDEQIDLQRTVMGFEKLEVRLDPPSVRKTDPAIEIDLSGIAKGYAVDRVADLLEASDCENYMVEVGGEIRAKGKNFQGTPWRIAIEKPDAGARVVHEVLELRDGGMATSGDYRNYFEKDGVRYSHLLDPRTGRPIRHRLASVTVLATTCAEADAWATALMVLGSEEGLKTAERENVAVAFLIRQDDQFIERQTTEFMRCKP